MRPIEEQIDRGIELLTLCQRYQTEKDGIDRPEPFVVDRTKTLDQFARDIGQAATNMAALHKLIPMMKCLADLGRTLDAAGKIVVEPGDSYSDKALEFFVSEFGQGR
jgi:hypothetical protein